MGKMKKILLATAAIATFSGVTANAADFHLVCKPDWSSSNLYIVEKDSTSIKFTRGATGSSWSFASSEWKMTDTHYFGEHSYTNTTDTEYKMIFKLNRISGRLDVDWKWYSSDGTWIRHIDSFWANCSKQKAQF